MRCLSSVPIDVVFISEPSGATSRFSKCWRKSSLQPPASVTFLAIAKYAYFLFKPFDIKSSTSWYWIIRESFVTLSEGSEERNYTFHLDSIFNYPFVMLHVLTPYSFPGCIYTVLIFLVPSIHRLNFLHLPSLVTIFLILSLPSPFSSFLFLLPPWLYLNFLSSVHPTNSFFILLAFDPSFLSSPFFQRHPLSPPCEDPQAPVPASNPILSCSVWSHPGSHQHWCPRRRHEHCCPCLCPLLTLPGAQGFGNQRCYQWTLWWQGNESIKSKCKVMY